MSKATTARRRRGQGMTEYIVIVGIIAILSIGVIERFGKSLEGAYNSSTDAISRKVAGPVGKAKSSKAGNGLATLPSGATVGDTTTSNDGDGQPPRKKPGAQ